MASLSVLAGNCADAQVRPSLFCLNMQGLEPHELAHMLLSPRFEKVGAILDLGCLSFCLSLRHNFKFPLNILRNTF